MQNSALDRVLEHNRKWAAERVAREPDFFRSKAGLQAPDYIWIGCSDSRVMANEITGLEAGELFVHRNIANQVVHTDFNCLSVLQFGIEVLGARDIIVCGHYGCGGIRAALLPPGGGFSENWLQHIRDVADTNAAELDALPSPEARARRLAELNVVWQVRNVASTAVVRAMWASGESVRIHGVIYSLEDGLLTDLGCSMDRG